MQGDANPATLTALLERVDALADALTKVSDGAKAPEPAATLELVAAVVGEVRALPAAVTIPEEGARPRLRAAGEEAQLGPVHFAPPRAAEGQ